MSRVIFRILMMVGLGFAAFLIYEKNSSAGYNSAVWKEYHDKIYSIYHNKEYGREMSGRVAELIELCAKARNEEASGYTSIVRQQRYQEVEDGCEYKRRKDKAIDKAFAYLSANGLTSGEPIEMRCLGWSNLWGQSHWDKAGVKNEKLTITSMVVYERQTGKEWYGEDCETL